MPCKNIFKSFSLDVGIFGELLLSLSLHLTERRSWGKRETWKQQQQKEQTIKRFLNFFFSEAIFINFLNVPYMLQAHCCMNVFTLALCLTAHLFYALPIQKRRRGCQRMRWLDVIDAMDVNLSKLQEMVRNREACSAAVHGVAQSWTQLGDWTTFKA